MGHIKEPDGVENVVDVSMPAHRDSLALARLLLEAGADPNDGQTLYNAACSYAQLGETEAAFDALRRWLPTAGIEKTLRQRPSLPLRQARGHSLDPGSGMPLRSVGRPARPGTAAAGSR